MAEKDSTEHHRQRTEARNAGRDVGFLVKRKSQFDEMEHAMAVQ